MTEYSEKDLNYALDAIKDSSIRNTEEFKQWISKEENRILFTQIMMGKEAVMREKHIRKSATIKKYKIVSIVSAIAAVAVLAIYIPKFYMSSSAPITDSDIHFFTAKANIEEVILESADKTTKIVKDSIMVLNTPQNNIVSKEVGYQTLTTPRGKDFKITLSDGTKVWINTESCLKFPLEFIGNERRVLLNGEAYFDVAHNEECPFIVCCDGIETKVLGTKFNVCSYNNEQRNITLVEGKIEVSNTISDESTILHPGQNISYYKDEVSQVSEVNTAVYTAWTEGMFYFEDKPLEEIMNTLGRWYNVDIYFEKENLYNITFNFWASKKSSIEEFVALLNNLGKVDIEFIKESNRIIVRENI